MESSLKGLHEQGIYHRDIKPENIILNCAEWSVKFLDFDLAEKKNDEAKSKHLIKGSPYFLNPKTCEEYRKKANMRRFSDDDLQRADYWAMGICVHEMLTGEIPDKYKSAKRLNDLVPHIEAYGKEIAVGNQPSKMPDQVYQLLRKGCVLSTEPQQK